jgi:hypothetical protein
MERPKRSEDARPGPPTIIQSDHWQPSAATRRRPTTVTECDSRGTTAAPDPSDMGVLICHGRAGPTEPRSGRSERLARAAAESRQTLASRSYYASHGWVRPDSHRGSYRRRAAVLGFVASAWNTRLTLRASRQVARDQRLWDKKNCALRGDRPGRGRPASRRRARARHAGSVRNIARPRGGCRHVRVRQGSRVLRAGAFVL